MASWSDLQKYVGSHYTIAEENPGFIKLVFVFEDDRSQMVLLSHVQLENGTEDWVQIESPFATVGQVDLLKVLGEVSQFVCGGLSRVGDHLTIKHAVPLANLNINEFERPLTLVTTTADELEQRFAGSDRY